MTRTLIGEIDGKETHYLQCLTLEDAKKEGFPPNVFFCWERDGVRIYDAGQILKHVQSSVANGNFAVTKLMNQQTMQTHYNQVAQAQKDSLLAQLTNAKDQYIAQGFPTAVVQQVEQAIKNYSDNFAVPAVPGLSTQKG